MGRMRHYLITIFLLVLLPLIAPLTGCSKKDLGDRVDEYTLENGMKWLLLKRDYAPVFAGVLQVKAGGADETRGKTGLAHLLEHMSFKGTSNLEPNEIWEIFTRNGASNLNAYTSKDVTTYHAEMPNSKLELWFYLVSEMISDPSFKEFDVEKKVVMEELRTSIENDPRGKLFTKLLSSAFHKSPYGWPTIGLPEDVAKLKKEDLENFYKSLYLPECMVGAIVGDIDIGLTKQLIKKYFGGLKGESKTCIRNTETEPQQIKEEESVVNFNTEPILVMAFHKPTAPHHDDYIFDVFSYVLCSGDSSRMQKKLVLEKKLAKQISCFSPYPGTRLPNLFIVYAEPFDTASLDALKAAIIDELKFLAIDPISSAEFEKARSQMKAGYLAQLDSNFELANMLVDYENTVGDWHYILEHPKVIDKITTEELIDAAGRYFIPENMTVVKMRRAGE